MFKVVDSRLVSYIRQNLNRGYTVNALRDHLIKNGYPASAVDEAINAAYGREVKHVVSLSSTTIIAIILVAAALAVLGAGAYFLFSGEKVPDTLLDFEMNAITNSVKAGENFEFNVEAFSIGSQNRYDFKLTHKVLDSNGDVVTEKTETPGIETRISKKSAISIPDGAKPGKYTLESVIDYGGKKAEASLSFKVYQESVDPTCTDNIQNQGEEKVDCGGPCDPCKKCPSSCDDNDKCTEDRCDAGTDYECKNVKKVPCCGDGNCETGETLGNCAADCKKEAAAPIVPATPVSSSDDPFEGLNSWQKIEKIKEVAQSDPDKAAGYCESYIAQDAYIDECLTNVVEVSANVVHCNKMKIVRSKERCLSDVALIRKDGSICSSIIDDSRKDSCYMGLANLKDYSVCDKIVNNNLKTICMMNRDHGDELAGLE